MNRVDVIVFGATGFTGKYAAKNLALLIKNVYTDLKWGISGRSREKLNGLLEEFAAMGVDTTKVTMIESDINNEESLKNMTQKTKVLMNCTGPYTDIGEPVVKACIETGTHYLDITAELYFMMKIYRKYNRAAENANVLLITACGFGSVPAVMGFMHLEKHFQGVLNSVECYTVLDLPKRSHYPGPNTCLIHYGTWASLVHELKNFKEYEEMKNDTFPEPINEHVPEGFNKSFFHKQQGKLWFPYPGPDHDVVEITQRHLKVKEKKKPVPFKVYTTMPLLLHFFTFVPIFFIYYYLCYFKCFVKLLLKCPGLFTLGYARHSGPSVEMARDTKYSFTLIGKGWNNDEEYKSPPEKTMTLKVSGSDPGYNTTGIILSLSAITLLKDQSRMPKGGVLTTGVAFKDTQLVDRLNNNGVKYEFIDNS